MAMELVHLGQPTPGVAGVEPAVMLDLVGAGAAAWYLSGSSVIFLVVSMHMIIEQAPAYNVNVVPSHCQKMLQLAGSVTLALFSIRQPENARHAMPHAQEQSNDV
jgi:hypothetical protein